MALRIDGWRSLALAAACVAAAGAPEPANAQSPGPGPGTGQGQAPGRLVWGGRMPLPGEAYVPSVPRRDRRAADDPAAATGGADRAPQAARTGRAEPGRRGPATAGAEDPGGGWMRPAASTLARAPQRNPSPSRMATPDFAAPEKAAPGAAPREVGALQGVPRADERLLIEDLLGRPAPDQDSAEAAPRAAAEPEPEPADTVFGTPRRARAEASPPPMEPAVSVDAGEIGGPDGEDRLGGKGAGDDPADDPGDDPAAADHAGEGTVEASMVFPNTLPDRGRDPWEGLKKVTPGAAEASRDALDAPDAGNGVPDAAPAGRTSPRGRVVASLGREAPPASAAPNPPGRGRLEAETPSGYRTMPRQDALCRAYLRQSGVKFVDAEPVGNGRSCGISHPVKIYEIAPGVAMKPAALMNCGAAARISQWVRKEVEPAARWKMWTGLKSVLNASSYRCSRIAGSHTISEHASGNALDVAGFEFTDGDTLDVERQGFFSFRSKAFQKAVRHSACRHFGTVLGPGYNYDHRNHLHLDARNRRRVVCK